MSVERDEPGEHGTDQDVGRNDAPLSDAGAPDNAGNAGEDGLLARVRYGLGKELLLYPDAFVVLHREEAEETRLSLDSIRRLILAPGDPNPAKLILMFDLDDSNTIIAAEGMTNVSDFRKLLARLHDLRPEIELDPPDMDTQLQQALGNRRRSLLGCYGSVLGSCVLIYVIYLIVAYIGAHGGH